MYVWCRGEQQVLQSQIDPGSKSALPLTICVTWTINITSLSLRLLSVNVERITLSS